MKILLRETHLGGKSCGYVNARNKGGPLIKTEGGREREREIERPTIIANQEGVFSVLHNTPSHGDCTLDVFEAAYSTNVVCLPAKSQSLHQSCCLVWNGLISRVQALHACKQLSLGNYSLTHP